MGSGPPPPPPPVAPATPAVSHGATFPAASGKNLGSASPVLRCSQDVVLALKKKKRCGLGLNVGAPGSSHPEQPQIQEHIPLPLPPAPATINSSAWPPGALKEGGLQGFSQPLEKMSQLPFPSLLRLLNAGICRCPISSSFHLPSSSAFLLNPLARHERKFSFLSPNHILSYSYLPVTCQAHTWVYVV